MPTPRRDGAPLVRLALTTPAFKGLNKQAETSILGPEWATICTNVVFDAAGRVSARKGWTNVTGTPMTGTPVVEQIHEHVFEDGTVGLISAAGSKLWSGFSTPADITGTATVTVGNNWQFVNFNGKCIGVQQGEAPIIRSSGNFADLVAASGSVPQGNCAVVHSGRVWVADSDKQVIKYSALLDETHWTTGAGNIDMSSVWPQGTDEIIALAMFNGAMVVFGKNRIVLFGDGAGSALGINPSNIYVYDTIVGTGCIARDSVQQIDGGDILFLSTQGVQSLGRLIQQKSNPITNVSANIRDYMNGMVASETKSKIRGIYSPEESLYLLLLPSINKAFAFDTSGKLEDGSLRVTEWDYMARTGTRALDGTLYLSLSAGAGGKLGTYSGYSDNGTIYNFDYASAWLDLGEDAAQYIKILKNIRGILYISGSFDAQLKWDLDFEGNFETRSLAIFAPGTSEWNIMEWGVGEWSGGLALRFIQSPAAGSGQYVRVGLQAGVTNQIAVQELTLYTKIGRLAK
jgi:hypothetical protein